jgi:hypothetical protein
MAARDRKDLNETQLTSQEDTFNFLFLCVLCVLSRLNYPLFGSTACGGGSEAFLEPSHRILNVAGWQFVA